MPASRVSLCARACDACARARGWQRERAPARRQIKKMDKRNPRKFLVYSCTLGQTGAAAALAGRPDGETSNPTTFYSYTRWFSCSIVGRIHLVSDSTDSYCLDVNTSKYCLFF